MEKVVNRFDVYLTNLDPTAGSEIQKTRPCMIISPDEMNRHIRNVIVAPMTTAGQENPHAKCMHFQGEERAYRFGSDTNHRQNETGQKPGNTGFRNPVKSCFRITSAVCILNSMSSF